MNNENKALKTNLSKQKLIQRGLIILALLFGFCFILYNVLSLRSTEINGAVTWGLLQFDETIRNAVLNIRKPVTTAVFRFITWYGNPDNIIAYCLILLIVPKTRLRYGFPLGLAAMISVTIQTALKTTVMRPRPDISEFLISQGGFSFPSGHSCSVLVFFWFLAFLVLANMENRRLAHIYAGICIAIVPLIGFSRLYLGVHYPTDILAGWCLGTAMLLVYISVYEIIKYYWKKRCTVQKYPPDSITIENKAEEEEYSHDKNR